MIVAKETGTCDAGPGVAASCLFTKMSQVGDILIARPVYPTPSEAGTIAHKGQTSKGGNKADLFVQGFIGSVSSQSSPGAGQQCLLSHLLVKASC